jgi:hypothetical protein
MSTKAIDELAQSVQKVVAEIKRLRRENTRLEEKAGMLERRLEEAVVAPAAADGGADWRREREELRGRVAALAEHLASALDEAG